MRTNPRAATAALPFFPYNSDRENIFAVQPGVPAADALETASSLLEVALDAVRNASESCEGNSANAADHLITMARALIDALWRGRIARTETADDYALANVFARLTALRENGVLIIAPDVSRLERDDATGFLEWAGQQAKGGAQ